MGALDSLRLTYKKDFIMRKEFCSRRSGSQIRCECIFSRFPQYLWGLLKDSFQKESLKMF